MNKTNRILVVLFFAQLLLIMGMHLGGEEQKGGFSSKVFEGFDPAKVTRIKILGEPKDESDPKSPPQTSVELAKDGTQWGVASAEAYPADGTKVQEFLDKIVKLKTTGPVVTKAANHKKLEVADDKFQRKITLTHDGQEMTFFLGTSPSFKTVHLRKAGTDEVLAAGELTSWESGTRAWDWVDRTYVKFPEKDVYAVVIQNKSGTIRLDRAPDGTWTAAGVTGPTKKSIIDDLVRKASSMNLEEPIAKSEKPEFGLGDPLATITLTTGTSTIAGKMPDEMKTDVIKIGKKTDTDNRYYVKASTSQYVVQVASWAVDPLVQKTNKDLLDTPKKDDAGVVGEGTPPKPGLPPAKAPPTKAAPKK